MEPNDHTQPKEGNASASEQHEHGHEHSNHDHTASGRSGGPRFLLWIVVAAIIILIIAWAKPSDRQNDETLEPDYSNSETDEKTTDGASSMSFLLPGDWELYERAGSAINRYLGEGQEIVYGIVQDPTDQNIVYFASSAYDRDAEDNLVSLYRYQIDNYNFERVFRRTYNAGKDGLISENLIPTFHVVGYENGGLILFVQSVEDSLDACEQPLLVEPTDATKLITLDLEKPYDGFEDYIPTEEAIEEARAAMESCKAELE